MVNFFESIGMRGLLTILGVRMTPGSIDSIPQSRSNLCNSFNQIFKVEIILNNKFKQKTKERDIDINENYSTKITVGARALAKHADRDRDSNDEVLFNNNNIFNNN